MKITSDDILMPTRTRMDIYKEIQFICEVCDKVTYEHDPHTLTDCLKELKREIPSSCSCGRNR